MSAFLHLLQYAVAFAFVALGLRTLWTWIRARDRASGYLALAIGGLGLVSLIGRIQPVLAYREPWAILLQDLALAIFIASGLAVLLFRGTFIPLSRRVTRLAVGASVLVGLAALASALSPNPSTRPTPLQTAVTVALVLLWSACVGEPIVRFWLQARGRPSVQRSRLRALSLGFGGLVLILLVATAAGPAVRGVGAQIVIELAALATVPILYSSFAPPTWLRRMWREREEGEYRAAIQSLLLFSPSRKALADHAVQWAARLVGADGAILFDADGSILAASAELSEEDTLAVQEQLPDIAGIVPARIGDGRPRTLIAQDLPTSRGRAKLAVLSGPFTPVFGTDELLRLEDYSSAVTAGLDRTGLTERVAALERTKTQFLNLASHELRGPVTVLRGYLSMFERGTLPQEQIRGILPVLVAKVEEMNLMVEQMLEASRLEEGRLELHIRRQDLRDLVARSVAMMGPLADAAHPLVVHSPEQPVLVDVDADRINIVLNNLLDNAIKYSPEGGEVRCEVECNATVALVRVSDKGIGIAESQLPHLFTRFGRIVTHETSSIRGTGLGLYLARELTRMHGGDVTVDSTPGKGSTFVMAVPLAS